MERVPKEIIERQIGNFNKVDPKKSGMEIIKEHMPEITNARTLYIIVVSTGIVLVLLHLLNMIDWCVKGRFL